jgi:hypothetical protein
MVITRAAGWFLRSGIQEHDGGVARYYRSDVGSNRRVSTEITGYAASTFVYLHSLTAEKVFLERAVRAARFLTRTAWIPALETVPFEVEPTNEGLLSYFFDCGVIVRGLLATWRATGDDEFLRHARTLGCSMARDFAAGDAGYHPVLRLPEKDPLARDRRWSRSAGCYQLKAAMAWADLAEATGEAEFRAQYEQALAFALHGYGSFLPGEENCEKVMDRLHAYSYFLEGMLPRASDPRCAAAICDGIRRIACYLREIAPQFDRSDVYAQLLRMRFFADWHRIVPLDREAAAWEATRLAEFQLEDEDSRIDGGFAFGARTGTWIPHVNPVSTGFALQALALWDRYRTGEAQVHRHLLI